MIETPFFLGITWVTAICLIILCVLLLFSALASASETAFFSLLPNDINEMENSDKRADKLVLGLRNKPKEFLATILITNNLVNVTITIFSVYIMSRMFNLAANPVWAFIINVVVVTSLLLIFGEMIPKITAAKKSTPTDYRTRPDNTSPRDNFQAPQQSDGQIYNDNR